MDFLQEKLGYDPFAIPEDHAGLNILFWPNIDEQIYHINMRLKQTTRALEYWIGDDKGSEDLTNDQTLFTSVLHTLQQVKKLRTGQRP